MFNTWNINHFLYLLLTMKNVLITAVGFLKFEFVVWQRASTRCLFHQLAVLTPIKEVPVAVTLAAVTQNLQHSSQVNSSPAVALLCFAVLVIGASLCQPEKTPRRFAWQRACRTVAAERMVQCEFFQLTMGANISSLYTRPLLAHVRSCSLKRLVNIS